ncbi:MAG: copper-translocating P-type ATPase [Bacteroidales bacterium]|nr:copper-translocating P-type ATPase [Bacteroidales bacterium]
MVKTWVKTYPVTGMSCASCALNVEKTLKRQPGVVNAAVNYADGSAMLELSAESGDAVSLQSAVRSIGYDLLIDAAEIEHKDDAQQMHYRQLKLNMIGSLILALPVMIISMFFMRMPHANLVMLVLTIPVITWFGRSFFVNAFKQVRHGNANMDTLIALSTGIAFIFSLFNTFFPDFWHTRGLHPHVYYEAASVIIAFILIGKVLEERAKSSTSSAIRKLMGLQPKVVTLVDETGSETDIPVALVKHGDKVRIRPGDKIPVDGEITEGSSSVDESTITGESIPGDKSSGDHVYAGTQNLNGSFILTARQVGSETVLSRIIETVRQAQGSKAPVQKTVDKVAGIFVPAVIAVSVLSFIIWMIAGGEQAFSHALLAMVTVLVIACPCALGLATPTAVTVAMGKGARNGILIKDAGSLERIQKINAIVLDKTGTITEGRPVVTKIDWLPDGQSRAEAEQVLMAMEKQSGHPLAESIAGYLREKAIVGISLEDFENISGKGIIARYNSKTYLAGNLKHMNESGVQIGEDEQRLIHAWQEEAQTIVCFAADQKLLAVICLADPVKVTSGEAVSQLKNEGITVYMLTGDNAQTAKAVAEKTGIGNFYANMLPNDKADFVKKLQDNGMTVAMVGDGINDSQALAQADVSIAMGKGSDIAMDTAGITIISSDLGQVIKAIRLSDQTVRTIHQNLFWAFIYNVIGIPIAAGALYPIWGFMLNPMIAAAAMAMSSVSVVSNSLRLRGKRL